MARISFAVAAAFVALSTVGCSSAWMSREEHDRETAQLTEYKNALEAENAQLRVKGADYDRMKAELESNGETAKFYSELAASLRNAFAGLGVSEKKDWELNPRTNAIEFKDGVLFDLGSWTISARGKTILKAI